MSENDILRRQEDNGQKEFYLILAGQFYHAYGNGAFALSRVSGYKVIRKSRKWGDLVMAGFPASCLDKVKQRISDARGSLRRIDERTMVFAGVDGTPNEAMVTEQELASLRATMNSYLGMMRHYKSQRLFHRVLRRISADWYRYTYISKRGRRVKLVARPTRRTASRRRAVA